VERGIPAVAFAVSGCIGASNRWDQAAGAATLPLLDVPGLEALARSGLEIGGHSRTHRSLVEVDAAGLAAPRLFAYPYGDHTSAVRQAVRQAGYAAAFGVSPGRILPSSDRYALPRVDIRRHHSGLRFRLRVALLGGGRLRRPARLLLRQFGRQSAALAPLAAALADTPGGLLGLAA